MSVKRPSFQFYPSDWSADIKLRSTSIAARGLWIEIMCIMHQSDSYGYFPSILAYVPIDIALPENAKHVDHLAMIERMMELNADFCSQLSRMVGSTEHEVCKCMKELARAQVFSFSADGKVFSKRMVSDEALRNIRAEAGRKGGNPAFKKNNSALPEKTALPSKPLEIPPPLAGAGDFSGDGASRIPQVQTPQALPNASAKAGALSGSLFEQPDPDIIGDPKIAFYKLEGEVPHQKLKLFVTEAGKARLQRDYPTVNADRLCNNLEFYWNTMNGMKKRPAKNVYTALSLAARKDVNEQAFRSNQSQSPRKVDENIDGFVNRFNSVTKGFTPSITLPLSFDREVLVKNALAKHPDYAYWMDVFSAIRTHVLPPNCGFDWLLKSENNWIRVKERTFEPRKSASQTGQVNANLTEVAGVGVKVSSGFGNRGGAQ